VIIIKMRLAAPAQTPDKKLTSTDNESECYVPNSMRNVPPLRRLRMCYDTFVFCERILVWIKFEDGILVQSIISVKKSKWMGAFVVWHRSIIWRSLVKTVAISFNHRRLSDVLPGFREVLKRHPKLQKETWN